MDSLNFIDKKVLSLFFCYPTFQLSHVGPTTDKVNLGTGSVVVVVDEKVVTGNIDRSNVDNKNVEKINDRNAEKICHRNELKKINNGATITAF